MNLKEIDSKLSSAERWMEAVKNGPPKFNFANAFLPAAQQLGFPTTPVQEARHAAKPELPSPGQLAVMAALVGDKDAWFTELEKEARERNSDEPEPTAIERAMRRAVCFYLQAAKELKSTEELDAVDLHFKYHDLQTAAALYEKFSCQQMETDAWRFYPDQPTDKCREYTCAALKAGGIKDVEYKSRYGLPTALRRWRCATVEGLKKRGFDAVWKERRRAKGAYYLIHRHEIEAFIKWRLEQHRKGNVIRTNRSRKKQ